jgi:hypothetical protein
MTLPIPEDQANWLMTADLRSLSLPIFSRSLAAHCVAAGLVRLDREGRAWLTMEGVRTLCEIRRSYARVQRSIAA